MGMVSIASSRAGPEMATWETHNTGGQGGWGQNMTGNILRWNFRIYQKTLASLVLKTLHQEALPTHNAIIHCQEEGCVVAIIAN